MSLFEHRIPSSIFIIDRCQWVDVTSYNTSSNTYTDELVSSLNPDNFLCEGVTRNETWIPTNFTTMCCSGSGCCGDTPMTNCCGGLPVSKQGCNTWKGATDDNLSKINVTLPLDGEGQLTANCASSSGTWGPQRDCGFRLHPQGKMLTCGSPGRNATVKNVTAMSEYQVFYSTIIIFHKDSTIFCSFQGVARVRSLDCSQFVSRLYLECLISIGDHRRWTTCQRHSLHLYIFTRCTRSRWEVLHLRRTVL